jgi:flagellar biosynthetic protein FliP
MRESESEQVARLLALYAALDRASAEPGTPAPAPSSLTPLATTRKRIETSLARLHQDGLCAIERSRFGQNKAKASRSWSTGWLRVLLAVIFFGCLSASAQTNFTAGLGPVQITLGGGSGSAQNVDSGIKVLFIITLLTLAPSILLLMTCFTRIVIVLSFVRTALQLQGTPANQIIIGLSLFTTYFVMAPVWDSINRDAIAPYQAEQISSSDALARASDHISAFMLKQTRPKDVELFVAMAKLKPTSVPDLPLRVIIPAFIISELRTAFQMGFLIFVPFILIDLVVATVLMSMGMMMMPPMTISLPLKLLLFVLIDGWELVVRSLVRSFGM